ncbi:(Fe-S)-binding protein [Marinospirillum alkaliphilum]|uniref:Cysteine-rich domain-containing protein n=1 Tax=Marinospirillum alkaliphilum DSM 21637 TaxID=1122209 RepID=A0A1K1XGW9_9GAMM|nr:(Fe-S)-binding protein [Marinospirillum alkaliphilum]SFX48831.1 Cysteine-rich domain-containing protein [Marinospirillum alkaliphilum DSM 21637]
MKHFLDWREYKDAGMGDAYADIPRRGGDFAKAVAVCINSRQCETRDRGVMCPSYRVTGDPAFTPGGRVKLLKRALNSESPETLLLDQELAKAMALCVGCKGCKRECENSVDLAQIKLEYLAQRHSYHGAGLRTRLLGKLPQWMHRWPLLGRLPKLHNRFALLRQLNKLLLGLAPRTLPVACQQPFREPLQNNQDACLPPVSELRLVLFVDSWTRHYQPELAEAALELLQAGGCEVQLVQAAAEDAEPDRPLCCGRSLLAQGLIKEARHEAQRVLHALLPWVEQGYPIVGLEPSCLLALRDDYRALGLGDAAEKISRQSWLLEEFLARELRTGKLKLNFTADPLNGEGEPLLVHGHCHQKAVGAMKSMRKVLSYLPGTQVEFIEASCCGMGGSFGYEKEHHALSQAMAADALLPALEQQPQAAVLANGFSCRQQIISHTGRQPRHLVQLLRDRLQQ